MARKATGIDEKIEKAEAAIAAAKHKYDMALDELEKLVTKRKQMEEKRILEALRTSDRTTEEILAFLESKQSCKKET